MSSGRRRTMMTSYSPSKSPSSSVAKPADPQQRQQQQQPMTTLLSFFIGSLAGTCGSLAGMGGGFIMIPLMTSRRLLGLTQHQAHGTSLFAVTTTGIAGAISYGTSTNTTNKTNDTDSNSNSNSSISSNVDVTAAAAIAFCGMMTARAGALATSRISEVTLRKALGAFMLCVAPLVPAKEYLRGSGSTANPPTENNDDDTELSLSRLVVPGMIGCCSGFLAGVFGVGGGAVVVPALTISTDMNHYQALGTSLCAMVPTAIVGTLTHYQKGNVVMRVAPGLAFGAFTGAYFGGKLGLSIPETQLKYGFSTVMIVLGLQALLK
eukprot:CAMPEP_0113489886 /NCGR_PEP_ID=MMETSP0014_2-20120614/26759_1 /TAXON_ID=2857 /ORGANISM="Nitzschia sp." /LENGTH=320 /DNA_ID=CAMNT_0000383635 /DNA_START=50 /DNA_END=1012 /DNA_ORIENTATION=+ /assembly_acc=CAM_ASM_000159